MTTLAATDAKYGCGRLLGLGRPEPVAMDGHGHQVVVMMAIEAFERLKGRPDACLGDAADGKQMTRARPSAADWHG
jgi:hypothetical protein